ncbi:glutamate-rich protein 6 isoform X1 [Pezoporus flaviventris]|uniref:glutamate-rich protein 6 isoform X1 n=2 Tax=Pezoporus flaviventris TaxID=889875 RepID=UPI002AB00656|nr:glutamate-rich protein 6 isoform X1 [Pezoporus flaviventris]
MELEEDFVKLFKKSLRTFPSTGLPSLLAYRPESLREILQAEIEEDFAPRCEYCGSLLKPFPSFEDICPLSQDYESKFCCEHNRDLYEFIMNERKICRGNWNILTDVGPQKTHEGKTHKGAWNIPIDIGLLKSHERKTHEGIWSVPVHVSTQESHEEKTHERARSIPTDVIPNESHGTKVDRLLSEERVYERQLERRSTRQLFLQAAKAAFAAKRLNEPGTIFYQLSLEPPSPNSWTLMPAERAAEPKEEPISYSITCCDFTSVGGKAMKNELLEKYYKHGGKFLTMLPDGTVQLFYPSGNLAIIVVQKKKCRVCIVQEDKPTYAEIQALFKSDGRSTCYYPNGTVWIHMSIQGGQYLDQAGSRVKRWTWPNSVTSPGPHVPLKPIFISLNRHVGVRILGQDKIAVSFLAMGQQAKFNMGTKVQVSDVSQLPPPAPLSEDELLLLAFRVRILQLFDRLRGCLNFPSSEQWDKLKPPAYLITQTLKILQLCTSSDVSDELRSSVGAIINAEV